MDEPGDPELGLARFLCSQAILLAFKGVPALYIHSLLGTPNDLEGMEITGHNRTINRRKYRLSELNGLLEQSGTVQSRIFGVMKTWLERRRNHPAFHPSAGMAVRDLGPDWFVFFRSARDGSESILCLFNLTPEPRKLRLAELHSSLGAVGETTDWLNNEVIPTGPRRMIQLKPYGCRWIRIPCD